MNIQKNTIWFDEYNSHGDYDKATRALKKSEPEFTIKYIRTDGWRGYMKATAKKNSAWKKIIDEKFIGWVTGEWNDAPENSKGSELEKNLNKLDANEVKVIFMPTSNVFSTSYDVFVK